MYALLFTEPGEHTSEYFQRVSMLRLIGGDVQRGTKPARFGNMDASRNPYNLFYDFHQAQFVCTWNGVTCENEFVREIRWLRYGDPRVELRILDLEWLPPTVASTCIRDQLISARRFSTRYLPRASVYVDLTKCTLIGELVFRTAPEALARLIVPNNYLSGIVDFTCLPDTLIDLNALENNFTRVIVDNKAIPKSLSSAQIGSHKNPRINISVMEVSGQRVDNRIYVQLYGNDGNFMRLQWLWKEGKTLNKSIPEEKVIDDTN